MKKLFCIALILQMSCESVVGGFGKPLVYRCENDEVVCYLNESHQRGGICCKFKEGVL